jgi:hypothetical protein
MSTSVVIGWITTLAGTAFYARKRSAHGIYRCRRAPDWTQRAKQVSLTGAQWR